LWSRNGRISGPFRRFCPHASPGGPGATPAFGTRVSYAPRPDAIESIILLFEFFPAVLAVIAAIVAVMLFVKDRAARHDGE
jgi:hypothetical protein